MNVHTARLMMVEVIRDVLLDLADADGDLSDDEYVEMEDTLTDAAELILDALSVEVVEVAEAGVVTVTMTLLSPGAPSAAERNF